MVTKREQEQAQTKAQVIFEKIKNTLLEKKISDINFTSGLIKLNIKRSNKKEVVIDCATNIVYNRVQKHMFLIRSTLANGTRILLNKVPPAAIKREEIPGFGFKPEDQFVKERIKVVKKSIGLPNWPECRYGIPAIMTRSPLFGMIMKGTRKYIDNETMPCWGGYELIYTGYQQGQADLDVWLEVMHRISRGSNFEIVFSFYNFLKEIGKTDSSYYYKWLIDVFERFCASHLNIKSDEIEYNGKLIDSYHYDASKKECIVSVNPEIACLYEIDYVQIDRDLRLGISKGIEKWLCNYILSHRATDKNPHNVHIEKLATLSNSNYKQFRDFRRIIKKSETSLSKIVSLYSITKNDVLQFVRKK